MAYAAAVSLLQTLRDLQHYDHQISKSQIEILHNRVCSLKRFLDENREIKSDFEIRIRDAIYEVEDIIDSHVSTQAETSPSFCCKLESVLQELSSIAEMATEEFTHLTLDRKISVALWRKDVEYKSPPPIVGRREDMLQLRDRLLNGSDSLQVVAIVGVRGMGKTALVGCVLEDPSIEKHFDEVGSIKVPVEYRKRDVLLGLLRAAKEEGDVFGQKTDGQLEKYVYSILKKKRYLIFLDGVSEVAVWNDLKEVFPDYNNRSRILLTTRNMDVARSVAGPPPHLLDHLSDEDGLALLKYLVVGDEPWPLELAFIAQDISDSCRGLPLAVVIVGRLLRCADMRAEYWDIVLCSISTCEDYAELIEAVVSLTYKHLPQYLKPCLLYMAMFPYDYDITVFQLVNLLAAEGFVECDDELVPLELTSWGYLIELFYRGLVYYGICEGTRRVCRIYEEVFHDFFVRKAKEEKFFLIISKDTSSFLQKDATFTQQRRLCIQKNMPFGVKDMFEYYNSKAYTSIARSLLYIGPEKQYPLQAWLDFKLLKILDACKIRFYTFQPEILKLIQLRYLALSCNEELPMALCRLRNLQVLIILRYLSVKHAGAVSYLPEEIWNMKELRHLQVVGSDLPDPPSDTDLLLKNLLTLLDVSGHSCTRKILKRIPILQTLGIQIESSSERDSSLSFFSHLDILSLLTTFECVVMYPDIGSQVLVPSSVPVFPSSLRDVTLSGCQLPWKYMRALAVLPNLQALKLLSYAFHGPQWRVKKGEFPGLHSLILADMDLEEWIMADEFCFPKMRGLTIKHCYKLQEIPLGFGDISSLQMLEVVDCSTSVVNSAHRIEEKQKVLGNEEIELDLYSSWKH